MDNDGINADPMELEKFSQLAHRWWDPNSEFKPLHDINPLRLNYIDQLAGLEGKKVLDVGCGGGILSESMAARGADTTGIDLSDKALKVAKLHLLESGNQVDYRKITVEMLAQELPNHFDIVTCMEMLEHVPDPASVIQACADLTKPGGGSFSRPLIAIQNPTYTPSSVRSISSNCCPAAPMNTQNFSNRQSSRAWRVMQD